MLLALTPVVDGKLHKRVLDDLGDVLSQNDDALAEDNQG